MGRSMHKLSYFSPSYSGEEIMLLQLDLAGKVVYLLILIFLLLSYLQKWKRNRRGGRHVQTTNRFNVVRGDNGGETIRGGIARRVRAGGQYAGEVRFDVAGDDDGVTINGEIARRVHAGGQYAGEVRFDVASDEPDETISVASDEPDETIAANEHAIASEIARRVRFYVASDEEIVVGGNINDEIGRRVRFGVARIGRRVSFDVAGDEEISTRVGGTINGDDGVTVNGEIAMGRTAIAATMPFEFN